MAKEQKHKMQKRKESEKNGRKPNLQNKSAEVAPLLMARVLWVAADCRGSQYRAGKYARIRLAAQRWT